MRTLRLLVATLALGLVPGCVSDKAKQQIRDNAASSSADERDYKAGGLTASQVGQSLHDSAKAWQTLNYAINDVPIPGPYADPSPLPSPAPPSTPASSGK